jgi:hypothetical protein
MTCFYFFARVVCRSLTGPLWSSPLGSSCLVFWFRRFSMRRFWLGFCLILFRVLLKKSKGDLVFPFTVLFGSDWQDLFGRSALGSSCLYFGFGGLATWGGLVILPNFIWVLLSKGRLVFYFFRPVLFVLWLGQDLLSPLIMPGIFGFGGLATWGFVRVFA